MPKNPDRILKNVKTSIIRTLKAKHTQAPLKNTKDTFNATFFPNINYCKIIKASPCP